jgi:hypothetical protein
MSFTRHEVSQCLIFSVLLQLADVIESWNEKLLPLTLESFLNTNVIRELKVVGQARRKETT